MTVFGPHTNNPHLCPLRATSKRVGSHKIPLPKDRGLLWSVSSTNKLPQVVKRPLVLSPNTMLEAKEVTKVDWRQTQNTGTVRDARAYAPTLPSLTPSNKPKPPPFILGGVLFTELPDAQQPLGPPT